MIKTIQSMKDALQRYNAEANDIKKLIAANAEKYAPAVAEAENRRLYNSRTELANAARKAVEGAYQAKAAEIEKWAQYDGEAITGDIGLLTGAFDLNAKDIAGLITKYQNNFTMIQAVTKYARENNIPYIAPSADEKRHILDEYKEGALAKIQRIENECGIDGFYVEQWGAINSAEADRAINGLTLENASATMGNE